MKSIFGTGNRWAAPKGVPMGSFGLNISYWRCHFLYVCGRELSAWSRWCFLNCSKVERHTLNYNRSGQSNGGWKTSENTDNSDILRLILCKGFCKCCDCCRTGLSSVILSRPLRISKSGWLIIARYFRHPSKSRLNRVDWKVQDPSICSMVTYPPWSHSVSGTRTLSFWFSSLPQPFPNIKHHQGPQETKESLPNLMIFTASSRLGWAKWSQCQARGSRNWMSSPWQTDKGMENGWTFGPFIDGITAKNMMTYDEIWWFFIPILHCHRVWGMVGVKVYPKIAWCTMNILKLCKI